MKVTTIPVTPCPAPRMTRSDKWRIDPYHPNPKKRQRPVVTRYYEFKDAFKFYLKQNSITLTEELDITFILPLTDSWPKKKKAIHAGQKHQQRPDIDNMCKAIMDAEGVEDGFVHTIKANKVWGLVGDEIGCIIIRTDA